MAEHLFQGNIYRSQHIEISYIWIIWDLFILCHVTLLPPFELLECSVFHIWRWWYASTLHPLYSRYFFVWSNPEWWGSFLTIRNAILWSQIVAASVASTLASTWCKLLDMQSLSFWNGEPWQESLVVTLYWIVNYWFKHLSCTEESDFFRKCVVHPADLMPITYTFSILFCKGHLFLQIGAHV